MMIKVHSNLGKLNVIPDKTPIEDVIKELVLRQEDHNAFYVLEIQNLLQLFKTWKFNLPMVRPFYAVKCNDDEIVLKIMASLGAGFDCATESETIKIMSLGVEPDRIIYAHPCKGPDQLSFLECNGIQMTVFDNVFELEKIKKFFPSAKLQIRIRIDASKSIVKMGGKFGVEPDETLVLLKKAKEMNLNVVGVSFHVGSGCAESSAYGRAIQAARKTFDEARSLGFKPNLLNVGGGFQNTEQISFLSAVKIIKESLEKYFPPEMNVQFMAEPGRLMVHSAFKLATMVIGKQPETKVNDLAKLNNSRYYINDSTYGSFKFRSAHKFGKPKFLKEKRGIELVNAAFYGQTCDGNDMIIDSCITPRLEIGEWLMWEIMGAYTLTVSTTFNGFPIPRVYPVIPFSLWSKMKFLEDQGENLLPLLDDGLLKEV